MKRRLLEALQERVFKKGSRPHRRGVNEKVENERAARNRGGGLYCLRLLSPQHTALTVALAECPFLPIKSRIKSQSGCNWYSSFDSRFGITCTAHGRVVSSRACTHHTPPHRTLACCAPHAHFYPPTLVDPTTGRGKFFADHQPAEGEGRQFWRKAHEKKSTIRGVYLISFAGPRSAKLLLE